MRGHGAGACANPFDDWDDTVLCYCLSLGVQFGFQTFASPRRQGDTKRQWYPSTVFLATYNLTALLRDEASRCSFKALDGTPPASVALACAVREVHKKIFQQYTTWLKAAGLRPAERQGSFADPSAESLHYELADLALYWLVYSEAANLRHTPEMLWFIFYCAQRSWQAKQVRDHIRLHQAALEDLPEQPWLRELGPGLVRAVQTLHDRYCMQAAQLTVDRVDGRGGGSGGRDGNDGGVSFHQEATFRLSDRTGSLGLGREGSSNLDAACTDSKRQTSNAATGNEGGKDRPGAFNITVMADGKGDVFAPPAQSPCLSTSASGPTLTPSTARTSVTGAAAMFAARTAAPSSDHEVSAPTGLQCSPQHIEMAAVRGNHASAGGQPTSNSEAVYREMLRPVTSYRELLLRICPNETAVEASLKGEGGAGPEAAGEGSDSVRFLTRVVQPLFLFLTEQVYELGQARRQGLEAAVRIGYDDVSESMAHPGVVAAALAALPPSDMYDAAAADRGTDCASLLAQPLPRAGSSRGVGASRRYRPAQSIRHFQPDDERWYWSRLLRLGDLPSRFSTRIPWQGDMEHYRPQLLRLLQSSGSTAGDGAPGSFNSSSADVPELPGSGPGKWGLLWRHCTGAANVRPAASGDVEAPSAAPSSSTTQEGLKPEAVSELGSLRCANAAADWWALHVLRKTFAEHRSLAMPLLAFKRVFQFQLCWFYLICVVCWAEPDRRMAWVAAAAALHWGSSCLLWSMQVVLSFKPRIKRNNILVPSYGTQEAKRLLGNEPAAPYSLYGTAYHLLQIILIIMAWSSLFAGVYVTYTKVPQSSTCGHQGRTCYSGIFAAYCGLLFAYEVLYRQLNFGGYARRQFYQLVLGLTPQGTATASSSYNPLYDPAKHLRTGLNYLLGNGLLWAVTLGIKFVIDYFILIKPAGPSMREIMDTDSLAHSYRVGSRRYYVDLDPFMAGAQVIVLFLLSLVSTGVAYTVATALWGTLQGVTQGIGSIRHWRHIRAGFHRVQAAMRAKLLVASKKTSPKDTRPWVMRAASWLRRCTIVGKLMVPVPSSESSQIWEERERTLAVTAPFWNALVRSMRGRDLLSDREAAALSFTALSFSPSSVLASLSRDRPGGSLGVKKATYLPPMAVHVAQIPHMVITGSTPSAEQLEVLQQAHLCLLHLLVVVGAVADANSDAPASVCQSQAPITSSGAGATATVAMSRGLNTTSLHPAKFTGISMWTWSYKRLTERKELLDRVVALVSALVETGKVYDRTRGMQNDPRNAERARAITNLCMALHSVARCMTQMQDLPGSVSKMMKAVVEEQHFKNSAVTAELGEGFARMVDRHLGSIQYDDFLKASTWLLAILRSTDEGTAPSNAEAVSLLADFCSGLMHPRLPTAPRVDAMRAVSTLIPHYHETSLYALSSCDARKVLEEAGAKNLEDALADDEVLYKKDEEGLLRPSALLQYLLSTFPEEFQNLLERCRTLVPLESGELPYSQEDFLPDGRLYEHRAQLLLWASCRGQVLARTVDGMCMYRTALALQAVHDAMGHDSPDTAAASPGSANGQSPAMQPSQQADGNAAEERGQLKMSASVKKSVLEILKGDSLCVEELVAKLVYVVPGLGALLERKYGLVVASQVFSKMAGSKKLSDRWRAHGIALLATRYSAMRVAYLEQDGDTITLFDAPDFKYRVAHQASVLVRAVPLEQEVEEAMKAAADPEPVASSDPASGLDTNATVLGASTLPFSAGPSRPSLRIVVPNGGSGAARSAGGGAGGNDSGREGFYDRNSKITLEIWQRRFLLTRLEAVRLEVLFRLQLPVNYYDRTASGVGVILGEGKPENQNSAVPYCPGVVLQTIDMNQDNSMAQAFKLRNLTREFEPLGPGRESQQVAVLGYPEWIFSYRCGLLADLAAATERTFGTQIQRVMAFPSAVRANYGHPDCWHRPFILTRGGVSKSNAVQHVSEDVFGGYNALKRGGLSKYVSYISVGKGRDMGLDSILGFEGKISKGCAEQLMSRDLRFLGWNTDFFRSMSLYFTVPGHFINTWLTVVTIQLGIWVQLLLLLGGVGKTGSRVSSAIGAVQILQLGTMPLLGFVFNLWLESGMGVAVATLARHFIGGGLLFHIVRSVTSAFHLGRAVLFGGASYVATGRGFSLQRRSFTQVYCNYGRSHLYLGADILLMVILILVVGNNGGNAMPVPAAAMWSPLLVASALLAGPFWFTPFFFRLRPVWQDTKEFRSWVSGSAARGVSESWPEWNNSQLSTLRDDSGTQVPRYRFWSTLAIVVPRAAICVLSAITAITCARFESDSLPDLAWVFGGSAVIWLLVGLASASRKAYLTSGLAIGWRWVKGLMQVGVLGALAILAAVCLFMEKRGLRFSGVLITAYANYSVASLLVCVLVVWMPKSMLARSMADGVYKRTDAVLGTAVAIVLLLICVIGEIGLIMVDKVQTLVQFNDRYIFSQAARQYTGVDDVAGGGKLRRRKTNAGETPLLTPRGSIMGNGDGRRLSSGGGRQLNIVGGGSRVTRPGDVSPRCQQEIVDWFSPRIHASGRTSRPDWTPTTAVSLSLGDGVENTGAASNVAAPSSDADAAVRMPLPVPAPAAAATQTMLKDHPPAVAVGASTVLLHLSDAPPAAAGAPEDLTLPVPQPAAAADVPTVLFHPSGTPEDLTLPVPPPAAAADAPTVLFHPSGTPPAAAGGSEELSLPVPQPAPEIAAAPPVPQPSAAALEHNASYAQR